MQKIIGKFTSAVIYSDTAEDYAIAQTKMICDSVAATGSIIRVMPDVHPGKVGPIGLTMTLTDKVMPGFVGTDIGCGVSYMKIRKTNIEFQKLDKVIRERIPTGGCIRKEAHRFSADFDFKELICRKYINEEKAVRSLGTLGSGNHFIEVDVDSKGNAEWNYSAPHGAGRVIKKSEVKDQFTVSNFKKAIRGIHFSLPYAAALSEAPFAYRGLEEIREAIKDTVEIREILKPVYNYRAGER